MSTLKPTRKISRKEKLREDTVVTFYARAIGFFDQNRTLVYGVAGALVVAILVFVGAGYLSSQRETRAADEMAPAVRNYEQALYDEALNGVGGSPGLLQVIDSYGGTEAGNLARFYAADAYYRMGNHDEALSLFRQYEKDNDYLGASAYAGEADILAQRGEHADAARLYERAAEANEDDQLSPQYLVKAGRAYEAAGDSDRAVRVYERVAEDYPDSQAAGDTEFLVARAQARQ